jgi:hypothetical protein
VRLGDCSANAERLAVVPMIAVVLYVPGDAYPSEHRQLSLLRQSATVIQDVLRYVLIILPSHDASTDDVVEG